MAEIDSEGVAIHYDVYRDGDRPWLVFAHGAGGNAASWWQQVPCFYDDFNIVTFDHRGFGRSRCTAAQFDAAHFVGDLERVLGAAGVERAALVCQSMGGRTGLGFALAHPERVWALVMSHTVGGLTSTAIRDARAAVQRPEPSQPFGSWAVALDLPEKNLALAHLYNRIGAFNLDFQSFGTGALAGAPTVEARDVSSFDVPTLFVTADNDLVIPRAAVELGAAMLPGCRLVNLGDAGHSSYFEIAAEFNRTVAEFLRPQRPRLRRNRGTRGAQSALDAITWISARPLRRASAVVPIAVQAG